MPLDLGCGWERKSGTPLALAVFPWLGLAWRVAFWCAPLPVWGLFVLPVSVAAQTVGTIRHDDNVIAA